MLRCPPGAGNRGADVAVLRPSAPTAVPPARLDAAVRGLATRGPGSTDDEEWLDQPGFPSEEAAGALRDLERVHRWLLGHVAVRRTVRPLLAGAGPDAIWLDVGAGNGHVGDDLASQSAARGARLRVVALDCKLAHLAAGRRHGHRGLAVVAAAADLPFRDRAFDASYSNLLFHHFPADVNRAVLGEMRRVSRRAVVIVDLRRSVLTRLAARLFLRLALLGRTAYHDGIVSVRRSYRLAEVAAVVAGEPVRELRRRFPCRFSLVLEAGDREPGRTADQRPGSC